MDEEKYVYTRSKNPYKVSLWTRDLIQSNWYIALSAAFSWLTNAFQKWQATNVSYKETALITGNNVSDFSLSIIPLSSFKALPSLFVWHILPLSPFKALPSPLVWYTIPLSPFNAPPSALVWHIIPLSPFKAFPSLFVWHIIPLSPGHCLHLRLSLCMTHHSIISI